MKLKDELPRSVSAQYATGKDKWLQKKMKSLSQSKNNAQSQMWFMMEINSDILKKQYCKGTWNVRSMNQGKLEVIKQETAKVNTEILEISELKWTKMGVFNSNDHLI